MMHRNVAVCLIIVKFLQCVNIVYGQNTSFLTNGHSSKTHGLNTSFSTKSTPFTSAPSNFLSSTTSASKVLMTITSKKGTETTSIYYTSMSFQSWWSKFLSTSLIHSATFNASSSEYSAVISPRPSKSLESRTFSFYTGINTSLTLSSTLHLVNSSSTPILTSSRDNNFTISIFTIHASRSFLSSSKVPNETKDFHNLSDLSTHSHSPTISDLSSKTSFWKLSTTFFSKMLTTFKTSKTPNLQTTASSKESPISFSKETSATSSPRAFLLSSNMSVSILFTAFSTRMFTTSKTTKILKLISSPMSSMKHSTSFSHRIPATSFLQSSSQTLNSTTPVITTALSTSPTVTVVTTTSPNKSTMFIKSSEIINSTYATKLTIFSSSTTKIALSSSINVLNNISSFIKFDGKLLVSVKYSFKNKYNNLKKVADSIESTLDDALQQAKGYIYSKVLEIRIQNNPSWFQCMFKLFLGKSSSESASTLREKIKEYNETHGFGEFTLHSVETSVVRPPSLSEQKLYLWAIIVIGVLGVVCLLLLAALIYTREKLKRIRKKNDFSARHDSNSNQRYPDIFPSVFDGVDESQNTPLKLRSVSSTESKKPLKLSEAANADSQPDEENCDVTKSAESSSGESEGKDDQSVTEDQSFPGNGALQIDDDNDGDNETKFSTFSRKH